MATQKLLPPTIESKLPAQLGDVLSIPFLHNRSVGNAQYDRMYLKIKTISTNLDIAELKGDKAGVFSLEGVQLQVGQHYKAQLAYAYGENNIGYYSTVGIFKYTADPTVVIYSNNVELNTEGSNYIGTKLLGSYTSPVNDINEKAYSYCFNVYENDTLIQTTGEILHNSENDEINSSTDEYIFNQKLDSLQNYSIEYIVITSNGLTVSSPRYFIKQTVNLPNIYNFNVNATIDYDNGCVNVQMNFPTSNTQTVSGKFRLIRTSSLDNYRTQTIMRDFTLNTIVNDAYDLDTDYMVQQGVNYKYSVQQYDDNGLFTEPVESNIAYVDFEDMFLFDGKRQLKIKFNPKVSSFKDTILESKLDTIGGRYPFIFRNGRTKYKEFPISGLISYWMDNDTLFMPVEHLELEKEPSRRGQTMADATSVYSTNLTGNNIAAERDFKLEVLNWLNDGQPKLFRSPAEGNYIVRLMNVSLSPDDKLGRMLHTFNCNAYEISEYDLAKFNFIGGDKVDTSLLEFKSINDVEANKEYAISQPAQLRLYGQPGTQYKLGNATETRKIQIGLTGVYDSGPIDDKIAYITLITSANAAQRIEYTTFATSVMNNLTYNGQSVKSLTMKEQAAQFIGPVDVIQKITFSENENLLLENILVLRLEYMETKGKSEIIMQFNDNTKQTVELGANTAPSGDIILGRIEFTAADFDGKFAPIALTIGNNIKADIYYQVKSVEV